MNNEALLLQFGLFLLGTVTIIIVMMEAFSKTFENFWLTVVTAVLAIATIGLFFYAVRQAGDMEQAVRATNRIAEANRPWVFFVYPVPQGMNPVRRPGGINIDIQYDIRNYGLTPAIIHDIDVHLFAGEQEPDPLSLAAATMHETYKMPAIVSGTGTTIGEDLSTNQIIVPPNGALGKISQTLAFLDTKAFTMGALGFDNKDLPHTPKYWLFCIIKYSDVHGQDRETGYYAAITGAVASQPLPEHRRYNYLR